MRITKKLFQDNKKIMMNMIDRKEIFSEENMIRNGMNDFFIKEMLNEKIFSLMKDNIIWVNWKKNNLHSGRTLFNYEKKNFPSKSEKYRLLTLDNDVDFFNINESMMNKPCQIFKKECYDYIIYHKEEADLSRGTTLLYFFKSYHETNHSMSIDWQSSGIYVDCSDTDILYTFIKKLYDASKRFGVNNVYDFVDCVCVDNVDVSYEMILDMIKKA